MSTEDQPPTSRKPLFLLLFALLALFNCDLFDIFPPEIEIITPKEGVSYFGTLPCSLKVTDNRKVTKVEVFLDGKSVHEFTKSPYQTTLSLAGVRNPANLRAVAHDKAGNYAEAERQVSISLGFKLTAPNGGETWAEQSSQTITWTWSGDVGNYVSLHYSLDGGTNWTEITASTANNGSYAWTLPNFSETQSACKIKVSTDQYADDSDDTFTISAEPNTLTITAPNGGETWAEQSTQTITWTKSGDVGDYVSLHYSLDAGATWTQIISSTPNDGSHPWTLPSVTEDQTACRVKVASTTTSFSDTSDADFTISAEPNYITITSPNGGEEWPEQSTQTITWSYGGDVGDYVSLDYSIDGGASWTEIIASTANDGSHSWTLPGVTEDQTACRVKVASTSTSYSDTSDANFTVTAEPNYITLTSPNGGDVWDEQSTQTITWSYGGDVGDYVSLDYSIDGGASWTEIIASTANDGSHSWTLPGVTEDQTACRVKVASTSTSYSDTSDANFTVTAEPNYITLTSPNGGDVWDEQSIHNITWDYSGDVGNNVSLHYSLDGGSAWTQIIASTSNDGSHSWTLPKLFETVATCRVIVSSTSTSFADTSDANFTITHLPFTASVKLLAPDAQANDRFGYSVAISPAAGGTGGDYALVGAPDADTGGSDAGAAYIFQRNGANSWDGGVKLTAPDAQAGDWFGYSVDLSPAAGGTGGDYAVVGALYGEAAYIFQRTVINSWDSGTKIVAFDAEADDYFGWSVAISGDYAIVGARGNFHEEDRAGAAYVFQRTGANSWDSGTKLTAPDAQLGDHFGLSVAIYGDYAIAGAYGNDAGFLNSGAAYVFLRIGTNSWDNGTKLMASDQRTWHLFGFSVAISGDYALVGAYTDNTGGDEAGAAYIFIK